jgi:signal transduction histidine kinase
MRHRVRALGGRLDVRSPGSGGTTLLVRIPTMTALHGDAESAPLEDSASRMQIQS